MGLYKQDICIDAESIIITDPAFLSEDVSIHKGILIPYSNAENATLYVKTNEEDKVNDFTIILNNDVEEQWINIASIQVVSGIIVCFNYKDIDDWIDNNMFNNVVDNLYNKKYDFIKFNRNDVFCCRTGHGDGIYCLQAGYSKNGKIAKIRIHF